MDTEDKKPRVIKPASKFSLSNKRVRLAAIGAGTILAVLLIYFVAQLINNVVNPSARLISTVKGLENGHHQCSDGLKKLNSSGKQTVNLKHYSLNAQETVLNYLMPCEFVTSNTAQAYKYAQQLNLVYVKEGSSSLQKRQQLENFVRYMEAYNH